MVSPRKIAWNGAAVISGLLLFLPPFGSGQSIPPYPAHPSASQTYRKQLPAGWTVFRGGTGLIVPHPPGWKIQDRGAGSFIGYLPGGDGAARTVVFVKPVDQNAGAAMTVVSRLGQEFPDIFPNARVHKNRVVSAMPDVAAGEIQFSPMGKPFRGAALCFKHEGRGVLYVIGSEPGIWNREEPAMKYMLDNFFYAAGQGAGAPVPAMVFWRDPLEGSFVVPVPQGWKVEGGAKRFSAIDVRSEVLAVSPDEKILVRLGDAWIPPMTLPTQLGYGLGMQEGGWYGAPGVNQMLILRYLPSTDFLLHFYLPQRVGPVGNVRVRDLPEISRVVWAQMNQIYMGLMEARVDTGEIAFDFQSDRGLRKGYGFIQTELTGAGMAGADVGTWRVRLFHGYLADPHQEPLAQHILGQMVAGFQIDPAWGMAQIGTAGKVSAVWSQHHKEVSDMIHQTYRQRSASQDRIWGKWAQVNRGQILIEDPTTGQRFEVPLGSNYYWRIGGGQEFIGSQTPEAPFHPNLYIREMRILP